MDKILTIYKNIADYFPENRVDGVFLGEKSFLIKYIVELAQDNWVILFLGEKKPYNTKHDDLFWENEDGIYTAVINKNNASQIIDQLQTSYIEVLYLFNNNYEPMILIDDYPEDITINIKVLNILKA